MPRSTDARAVLKRRYKQAEFQLPEWMTRSDLGVFRVEIDWARRWLLRGWGAVGLFIYVGVMAAWAGFMLMSRADMVWANGFILLPLAGTIKILMMSIAFAHRHDRWFTKGTLQDLALSPDGTEVLRHVVIAGPVVVYTALSLVDLLAALATLQVPDVFYGFMASLREATEASPTPLPVRAALALANFGIRPVWALGLCAVISSSFPRGNILTITLLALATSWGLTSLSGSLLYILAIALGLPWEMLGQPLGGFIEEFGLMPAILFSLYLLSCLVAAGSIFLLSMRVSSGKTARKRLDEFIGAND